MENSIFTSPNGYFNLTLPENWEEYEDENTDERTFAFFNVKQWTGNLRVTHLYRELSEDKVSMFLEKQLQRNTDAILLKLASSTCIYFKTEIEEEDEKSVMYYWLVAVKNNIFVCSYTTDKNFKEVHQNQLQLIQDIVRSIKVVE